VSEDELLREITYRERAEEALRESRDSLEEAQAIAHVGSWTSGVGGDQKITWSRECYRIFGVPEGTPITVDSFFAYVHPADRERVRYASRDAFEHGAKYDLEHRVTRPDGGMRWVHERAAIDRDTAGRPIRMVGVVQDTTERHLADEGLRASEERYRRIVENTSEGVWLYDAAGTVTFMNERMAEMLGYTVAELVGRPIFALMAPSHRAEAEARMGRRRQGVTDRADFPFLRKGGGELWGSAQANPIFDANGHFEAGLVLVSDITARREAESALRRSEEQFRQAQKMEAVGRLAGGIAHDFNNLLSVILSYSNLAIDDLKPGDPLRDDLVEISKAGERATELTRQLLAFSRQQVLQPRVIDLGETVGAMERMLCRLLGEDIELTLPRSSDLGRVLADPGQIEQVVMNLAVNARDAMPDGGKLTIEMANVELDTAYAERNFGTAAGNYVMLAVSDTGIGMDAATRARIFEPFFTTKSVGKGTGLGLATVFGIVQQSGGHVGVDSEPGRGSTFKIYLPRTDRVVVAPIAARHPSGLRGPETILLVEDDELVRKAACAILRRAGYQVLDASNGGEAFLISRDFGGKIHLLLTDVVMPRMSGPKVAEQLVVTRPEMKVLFASGYTDDAIVHHGVLDAGVAFIQKPFTPETLLRRIREILDAAASCGGPPVTSPS
jgi:PAS domain S-box-containing protein